MLWLSADAPLTLTNRLEILQDAREKYPRLMADLRAASRSIHMVYYEWASDQFTDDGRRPPRREGVIRRRCARSVRPCREPEDAQPAVCARDASAGIEMFPYSPLYALHTISYRNHRKIAVIDGRIGTPAA